MTATALAAALGLEPRGHRSRVGGARSGRRDPARPLRSGRERRAMVRPASGRPHASAHREPSAGRDRAGRSARFSALPVRVAACGRRRAPRRAGRAAFGPCDAGGFRGAGAVVGDGNPLGPAQGLSAVVPRRRVPGRPRGLDTADARGWRRRGRSLVSPVPATPIALIDRRRVALWTSLAPRPARRRSAAGPRPCWTRSEPTARCSSTNWSTRPKCSAPRSRRRLANSSRRGSSTSDGFAGLRALLRHRASESRIPG